MNGLLQGVDYLLAGNEPTPSTHNINEVEYYQRATHEIGTTLQRLKEEVSAVALPEVQLHLRNHLEQLVVSARTLTARVAELPKAAEMRTRVRAALVQFYGCEEHQLLDMSKRAITLLREPRMPPKLSLELFLAKASIARRLRHASIVATSTYLHSDHIPDPRSLELEPSRFGA